VAPCLRITCFLASTLVAEFAYGANFGIYDARSHAMAGTAVAAGSPLMAAGYNPAILALGSEDEDKSHNGRYVFPSATANLAQVALDALDVVDKELDIVFDLALDEYNARASTENSVGATEAAVGAASAARDLEAALIDLANKAIYGQSFAPVIAISEPGNRSGGAFYLANRIEAGGRSFVPDADIALFKNYVAALEHVGRGGDWRDYRDIFDDERIDGSLYDEDPPPPLRDPFDDISSRADFSGLIINEVAVAGAWALDLPRIRVAAGFTPKVMQIRVFDKSREVDDEELNLNTSFKQHLQFNLDIGWLIAFDNGLKVGYSGKDLVTRAYSTDIGTRVKLESKHRLGMAFAYDSGEIGFDFDMKKNQPVRSEGVTQMLSLGLEHRLIKALALRCGYAWDLEGNRDPVAAAGLGLRLWRLEWDLSYQRSDDEQGASFQTSWMF
jgi:hypothetical protein